MIRAVLLLLLLPPQDDIEKVLERLKTEDAGERRRVQEELLRRGAAAVPAVLRVLESASPAPSERVEALVRQLSSRKWKERDEAMQALVRLGRTARSVLEEHAGSGDPEVAWRVRAALGEIQDRAGRDELLEELRGLSLCEFLGEAGDARGAAPLLRILLAGTPEQRPDLKLRAADALGRLREKMAPAQAEDASERILAMLEKATLPLPRGLLIKALGRLRSPACVRPLAALLADRSEKNLHLKRSCMAALSATGDARALRAVVDALQADDVYVRQGAGALLLEQTGDAYGFDPRLTASENHPAIGKFRAWWAQKFGQPWEE